MAFADSDLLLVNRSNVSYKITASEVAQTAVADRAVKAWVAFNGSTMAIRDSWNVSSVADLGVGTWEVTVPAGVMPWGCVLVSGKKVDDTGISYQYETLAYQTSATTIWIGAHMPKGSGDSDAAVVDLDLVHVVVVA